MNHNNQSYKIFTVESGSVSEGAKIANLHLKGANIDIAAILVGEEGRGRRQEAMPVDRPPMVPCPERNKDTYESGEKCSKCGAQLGAPTKGQWSETRKHPDSGLVVGNLMFADIGQTKAGKPKFFSKDSATTDEKIVVVFRTKMGFRGGNNHTGDRAGWKCSKYGCDATGEEPIAPEICPKCGSTGYDGPKHFFAEFPGQKLVCGVIAEGDAGRMGSGEQLIAVMPKGVVFRTTYSGRLYGSPAAHYYMWNGEKLIAVTWEERSASDVF
jgi:hypothetical protein